jgi:hypothetical protein
MATVRKTRKSSSAPEEIVSLYDDAAPLSTDKFVKPGKLHATEAAAAPADFATPAVELPGSVETAIGDIVGKLAPKDRSAANVALSAALQRYISNVRSQFAASAAEELAQFKEELVLGFDQLKQRKIAELEKAYGPTNNDDMQKLLQQEYLRFAFNVEVDNESGESVQVHFVIRELSQSAEKTIVDMLTTQAVPLMSKFQGIKFAAGSTNAEKISQAVKAVPEIFSILAEITATCLNPYGKRKDINKDWVVNNMSSTRMVAVVNAQFAANRIRDFFSLVSHVIQPTL